VTQDRIGPFVGIDQPARMVAYADCLNDCVYTRQEIDLSEDRIIAFAGRQHPLAQQARQRNGIGCLDRAAKRAINDVVAFVRVDGFVLQRNGAEGRAAAIANVDGLVDVHQIVVFCESEKSKIKKACRHCWLFPSNNFIISCTGFLMQIANNCDKIVI